MQGSLAGDLARLPALSREELVTEWRMLFGTEPPCRISQPLMLRALAYQFQAQAMGGLKPAVSRELKAIAEKGLQRTQAPPSLSPGTRLLREWHGPRSSDCGGWGAVSRGALPLPLPSGTGHYRHQMVRASVLRSEEGGGMSPKHLRCAIYTRKSSEEGLEQDFNSLHAQREASEAFIRSQKHEGWQVISTSYDDGGYSGGTMQRPALQQLMRDIEAGRIDVVVVYKVDRLSRSLHDFARMVEVFDRHGVSFVSVTQQFNTTSSMGRLTLNVLLSFAQFEREVTGERIRDKIAASKKKGMWMGGYAPLGYDIVERKLIIHPAEAETVRWIFRRYLELGSVRLLELELQRQGIRSKARSHARRPGGQAFSRGALYRLLSNPLYMGQIHHKGVCYTGQHEGIVEQAVWEQVQQQLRDSRAGIVQHRRKTEPGSLQGKLFDGVTGEPLKVVHANKKGRRYRYYVSQSLKQGSRSEAPNGWRLPGPSLEQTVLGIAREMLKDKEAVLEALQAVSMPALQYPALLRSAKKASQNTAALFHAIIQRVELQPDGIHLHLSLASLLPSPAEEDDIIMSCTTPLQMKRRGREMRWIIQTNSSKPAQIDPTLITTISRAHAWWEDLRSGRATSLKEIAARHQLSESYVKKVMPLAFLAPGIIEAILAGRQPGHLSTQSLIRRIEIPLSWHEQRQVLGFQA